MSAENVNAWWWMQSRTNRSQHPNSASPLTSNGNQPGRIVAPRRLPNERRWFCGGHGFGRIGREDGLVVGAQGLGQPHLPGIVVEALRQVHDAIERARIALERLFTQHHEGTFLRRYLSRAAVLLYLDRHRKGSLHVGRKITHAFKAPGRVAGLARPKPGVPRGLAVSDRVAITVVAG